MGRLYEAVQQVDAIIERRGLEPFKIKGQISMRTGFLLAFIEPDDADDERLDDLLSAVAEVLGEQLDV